MAVYAPALRCPWLLWPPVDTYSQKEPDVSVHLAAVLDLVNQWYLLMMRARARMPYVKEKATAVPCLRLRRAGDVANRRLLPPKSNGRESVKIRPFSDPRAPK